MNDEHSDPDPVDPRPAGGPRPDLQAAMQGADWEPSAGPTPDGGHRRADSHHGSRHDSRHGSRRHRSRPIWRVLRYALGGLLVLSVAWIVVTALLARSELNAARGDLTNMRKQATSDRLDEAKGSAVSLSNHAQRAHRLTTGPAWAVAAAVPWAGEPVRSVRGMTAQTAQLADHAVPVLLSVVDKVNPRTLVHGDTVDLAAMAVASPAVHAAAAGVATALAGIDALPSSTWLPPIDSARSTLASQFGELDRTLTNGDQALQVLPTMLGGGGTRRYFVGLQNSAELRGTGGLPGAFAIAQVTDGKISLERFEADTAVKGVTSGLDFGAAYNAHYAGDLPYDQYIDSNVSPHFPYAAQIWVAMWKARTGETLDGAIAVDPTALSYLLTVAGPTSAPDGEAVTGANLVSLTEKDVYAKFPEPGENDDRKQYLLEIARSVVSKVLSGSGKSRALLSAATRGVSERRILAWSAVPTVQNVLATTTAGGQVLTTAQPYSQLSVNNGSGGKLDYYLGRTVDWTRTGCGATRTVSVTITLRNDAPTSGLSPYVTERLDVPAGPTVPGQSRPVVDYLATSGAQLLSATLDGTSVGAGVFDELGHPVLRVALELPPQSTRTIVLTLREPAGNAPVTVLRQPGVQLETVTTEDDSCRP